VLFIAKACMKRMFFAVVIYIFVSCVDLYSGDINENTNLLSSLVKVGSSSVKVDDIETGNINTNNLFNESSSSSERDNELIDKILNEIECSFNDINSNYRPKIISFLSLVLDLSGMMVSFNNEARNETVNSVKMCTTVSNTLLSSFGFMIEFGNRTKQQKELMDAIKNDLLNTNFKTIKENREIKIKLGDVSSSLKQFFSCNRIDFLRYCCITNNFCNIFLNANSLASICYGAGLLLRSVDEGLRQKKLKKHEDKLSREIAAIIGAYSGYQ